MSTDVIKLSIAGNQIEINKTEWLSNKRKVAQIDIDAMKSFSELCPDELPVPGALLLPEKLNELALHSDQRIGSKCAHSEDADFVTDDPRNIGMESGLPQSPHFWTKHGRPGTKGFEMLDGLPRPTEYDHFIWKGIETDLHPYGVCYHDPLESLSTGLIEYLIISRVTTVLVTGLAFDFCVATTCKELASTGLFEVVLIEECTKGIVEENFETVRKELSSLGVKLFTTIQQYLENCGGLNANCI